MLFSRIAKSGGTEVELLLHHPKVEGSSLAGSEKMAKKVYGGKMML